MTQARHTSVPRGELVPLGDRLRYMLGFRVAVAIGVVLSISFADDHLFVPKQTIGLATAAFVVVAFLSQAAWQLSGRRGATLFGALLIIDGIFLSWASYATGGAASPVRSLILIEVVAVSLLASYRTGIKLAMWQSILLVAFYYARKGGILEPLDAAHHTVLIGTDWQQAMVFILVIWALAISTATFSAINERELRRRRTDLEALAALTVRLERESEPHGVADVLVHAVVANFGFERVLLVGAPEDEHFQPMVAHGAVRKPASEDSGESPADSVLATAARTRETQLVGSLDPVADAWLAEQLPDAHNLVVLPLTAEGGTVGSLIVEHPTRRGVRIERRLVGTLERFAAHGALALRNAWLLARVQDLAANDPLTGLSNRMTFGDALDRELARARRDGGVVTLVMLDIDHFKRLNDTRGHQAGDEVLRQTAATLREQQRVYDTVARYGGEEFALIAPGLTAADARATGERIRAAIEGNGAGVTASVGVATFPDHADGDESLIAAADAALYRSKDDGRNRVSVAGERTVASQ
jgi:two-component system, cell cycle response regulator